MLEVGRISRISTLTLALVAAALARPQAENQKPADTQSEWTIPANAANEVNPLPASPEVVAQGKKIFENRCQRCHGRDGRGHGPDADPDHPAGNLTDRLRAAFNPDGVMFYKIWNGRQSPKMPAFRKEDVSKEEVWTVIQFVKTFRK
jgi:mono/diheme cytochrome c family protein